MRKRIVTGILCWLVPAVTSSVEAFTKLGDESDGSQAISVHLLRVYDERGAAIGAGDEQPQPFSLRETCGKCHSYETISGGWHFNYTDANVAVGRAGQPWILVDAGIGTQVPVSYRSWPGAFHPEQLGLSPWGFVLQFGRHTPGGGAGELESDKRAEIMRQFVSGKLEINCLSCHNGHAGQDQGGPTGYAVQIQLQNFRWAATAACGFASVEGSAAAQSDTYDHLMSDAIAVTYREGTFDHRNRVLFDIVRRVANERCYFCHSNFDIGVEKAERWTADEDVHIAAGLTCVDCHRHGLHHNIVRGYEGEDKISGNPLAASSTCRGCHLGTESSGGPVEGRLGAPRPRHAGIPPIHFEKLSCTACHSGLWPGGSAYRTKTSRAHGLGTLDVNKSVEALPHVLTPVFASQPDDKIGPHKLVWPAFWGVLKDGDVTPIDLDAVRQSAGEILVERPPDSGDWRPLKAEEVTEVLSSLLSQGSTEGKPVYVCGGKLYQLDGSGDLREEEHAAGEPYLWPIAHNVRPAAQSLGVRGCRDCHATNAPFFFGKVAVDSPVESANAVRTMVEFQNIDPVYAKRFAFTFVFRPWLKAVILASCAGLAGVLILYALRALACVVRVLAEEEG